VSDESSKSKTRKKIEENDKIDESWAVVCSKSFLNIIKLQLIINDNKNNLRFQILKKKTI